MKEEKRRGTDLLGSSTDDDEEAVSDASGEEVSKTLLIGLLEAGDIFGHLASIT